MTGKDIFFFLVLIIPLIFAVYKIIEHIAKHISEQKNKKETSGIGHIQIKKIVISILLLFLSLFFAVIVILIYFKPEVLPLGTFWKTIMPFLLLPLFYVPIGLFYGLGQATGQSGYSAGQLADEFSKTIKETFTKEK